MNHKKVKVITTHLFSVGNNTGVAIFNIGGLCAFKNHTTARVGFTGSVYSRLYFQQKQPKSKRLSSFTISFIIEKRTLSSFSLLDTPIATH